MATMTPSRPKVFNLPNQLTLGRFVLSLVLFGLIAAEWWRCCLGVFLVAAFTDWLDGYLARKHGLSTSLGRLLDPLVDKVLMGGTFIFLLPLGREGSGLVPWMVTVVVARELVITGLRSYVEQTGSKFGADWLGKLKMGLQCAVVIAIFIVLIAYTPFLAKVRDCLIYAMLATTLLSGVQYLWRASLLLRNTPVTPES